MLGKATLIEFTLRTHCHHNTVPVLVCHLQVTESQLRVA